MKTVKFLAFVAAFIFLFAGASLPWIIEYFSPMWSYRVTFFMFMILYAVFIAIPALRALDKTFKDYNRYN